VVTRKEFIKKSAASIGTLFGADRVIEIIGAVHAAQPEGYSLTTNLAFIDGEAVSRMMTAIDRFGSGMESYTPVADRIFSPGMELIDFINRFLTETSGAYYTIARARGRIGVSISRSTVTHTLPCFESLFMMLGNESFGIYVRSTRQALTRDQAGEGTGIVKEIINAIRDLSDRFLVNNQKPTTTNRNENESDDDKRVTLDERGLYRQDYILPSYRLHYVIDEYSTILIPSSGNHLIANTDATFSQLSVGRIVMKSLYSRYSILNSYENYLNHVTGAPEAIEAGGFIALGADQFVGRAMVTLLFLELTAMRIKILAHQSQSSVLRIMTVRNFRSNVPASSIQLPIFQPGPFHRASHI